MRLELDNLKVECIIGERPEERVREQTLSLYLSLELTSERACETDELSDTCDYAALAEKISAALKLAKCKMIERAARIAADICLDEPLIASGIVKVTKFGAVSGLDSASVKLEF